MSEVRHDQSGYIGSSKSENARAAEKRGLFTASKIAKKLTGVNVAAVKKILNPVEKHHVSKFAHLKNFYSLDEAKDKVEKLRNHKSNSTRLILEHVDGAYRTWSGTRRYKNSKIWDFENCLIMTKNKKNARVKIYSNNLYKPESNADFNSPPLKKVGLSNIKFIKRRHQIVEFDSEDYDYRFKLKKKYYKNDQKCVRTEKFISCFDSQNLRKKIEFWPLDKLGN